MSEAFRSTMSIQFYEVDRNEETLQMMEAFCNETVRLVMWKLREKAPDPDEFPSEVSYGWFAIPEELGLYAIQVSGPHCHEDVYEVGNELQEKALERGYSIEITTVKV